MVIIPKPQKIEIKEEKLKFSNFNVITDNNEILDFVNIKSDKTSEINLEFKEKDFKRNEEYSIITDDTGITICYKEIEGAYRGFTTLKQILFQNKNEINHLYINDFPSIGKRSYMLDISRGKVPKLSYLKGLTDILSMLKYNELQLYMESIVYDYKGFSEYVDKDNVLSFDDIRELDEYCKKKFITLVPNQNGFGHMGEWTKIDKFSHLAITDDEGKPSATLNPLLNESAEFVDKIYDGLLDAFSSDLLHIGMDEPFMLGKGETKEICKEKGLSKVYVSYLNKICELAKKHNKTPMFWDDVIVNHENETDNVTKDAIIVVGGYEGESNFERNLKRLKDKKRRYYVCPGSSMWGSLGCGRTYNSLMNIADAAECGNYNGAEGFILTEWGDGGHPQFPAMTYFPMVMGGATSWNCGSHDICAIYSYRDGVIKDAIDFLDIFIYKTKGDKSLAKIVFEMGKFYLLEEKPQINGTLLNLYIRGLKSFSNDKKKYIENIKNYMENLRKELSYIKADEKLLREIILTCDTVICFSKKLLKEDSKEELKRIKKEYKYLWELDNFKKGSDIYFNDVSI